MADMIPARRRGRPRKTAAEAVPPTPETAAKLEPDHVKALLSAGRITPDQERAGRQIHALFLALGRGASPVSRLRPPSGPRGRLLPQTPLDRLAGDQERQWRDIYAPWMKKAGADVVVRRPRLTVLRLVEHLVTENRSLAALSLAYGVPQAALVAAFQAAMDAYNAQKREKKRL